jgi:hypothetical protein
MSDISNQNAERMIAESRRMYEAVDKLTEMVVKQNHKICTLSIEMAELKKAQIMATVTAQFAARGHGGTA